MSHTIKESLRTLNPQEAYAFQQVINASSARVDVVKRARAMVVVKAGKAETQGAREAGEKSGESIRQQVTRLHQQG